MAHKDHEKLDCSPKSSLPLRQCPRCDQMRDVEGGVELSPGKWRCADCWRLFKSKRM